MKLWHANPNKRQVRAPKVFMRDAGLLLGLLDIRDHRDSPVSDILS